MKYLAFALAALTAAVLLLHAAAEAFQYDEAVYLGIARQIGRTSCPVRPSLDPEVYRNNPPAVLYLAAGARSVGVQSLWGLRVAHVAVWGVTGVVATYGCARCLFGARAGVTALALLLTQTAFLREAAVVKFDTPLATLSVALVWAVSSKHRHALIAAGLLAATATFARYQGALLGPTVAIVLLANGRRHDAAWIFGAAVAGGLAWVGLANACDGDVLGAVQMNLGRVSGASEEPWFHRGVLEYWADLVRYIGPVLVLGVAGLVALSRRDVIGDPHLRITLAWPLVTLVFCSAIALKAERYFLPATPLLAVAVSSLARAIPPRLHRVFLGGMVAVGMTAAAGQWLLVERSPLTAQFERLGRFAAQRTPQGRALVTAQAQVAYFADRPYFVSLFEPDAARMQEVMQDPRVCTVAWDTRTLLLHPSIDQDDKRAIMDGARPRFVPHTPAPPNSTVWLRCDVAP